MQHTTAKIPGKLVGATTKYDRAEKPEKKLVDTYLSRQGGLNWIAQSGRMDTMTAVSQAASVMSAPKLAHLATQTQIFGYLNRTKETKIRYRRTNKGEGNELRYFCDGSYLGEGLSSRMGYVGTVNGSIFAAESKLAKFQCSGVFDVELAAAGSAAKDIVYRREFLRELGFTQNKPTPLHSDNQATISFVDKGAITNKNKHILVRGAYARSIQKEGQLQTYHIAGVDNPADMFTKNLSSEKMKTFMRRIGYIDI